MSTVKLTCAKNYDTKIIMHTVTRTFDVSLANEFQKQLPTVAHKNGVIDKGK